MLKLSHYRRLHNVSVKPTPAAPRNHRPDFGNDSKWRDPNKTICKEQCSVVTCTQSVVLRHNMRLIVVGQ